MELRLTDAAREDIRYFLQSGQTGIVKKIEKLLTELKENPFVGSGKPEPLKYEMAGFWSRRINKEHKLVYSVEDNIVNIHSARGHY
jgi:toxin YoeB